MAQINFQLQNDNVLDFGLNPIEAEDFGFESLLFNVIVGAVTSVNGETGDVIITPTSLGVYTKEEINSGFYTKTQSDNIFATKDDIKITIDELTFTTPQDFADFLIEAIGGAINDIWEEIDKKESKSNKTNFISAETADSYHYPTTKAVYDFVEPIQELIPNQASTQNQLADKNFVNSSVQTATANFRGNWTDWAEVPTNSNDYPTDYAGNKTPTVNDYLVVQDASDYTGETIEGTWRFKYSGTWATDGKNGWHPEYQVNETPLTAAQLAALNSGITSQLVSKIPSAIDINIVLSVNPDMSFSWSGADSIADIKNAYDSGASIRVTAPALTTETYDAVEIWWETQFTELGIQGFDNDIALLQLILKDDNSVTYSTINLQQKLSAGTGIVINGNEISATPITIDSTLSSSSTNPVQNQALYPAIVPTQVYKTVYTYDWTGPAGTNLYDCVAILTMPAGTFTDNSLVELVNEDSFNTFAKHGFVLYGSEVSTQRLWITSIGKPTGTVSFMFRIYKWGN